MKKLLVASISAALFLGACGDDDNSFEGYDWGSDPSAKVAANKAAANRACEKAQKGTSILDKKDEPDITYVDPDGNPLIICVR